MDIVCQKCGRANGLGRIFCAGCGARLDLSSVTRDAIADAYKPSRVKPMLKWVWLALFVVVLGCAALALWARGPASTKVSQTGAADVRRKMQGLQRAVGSTPPVSVSTTIGEDELNGYLAAETKGKDLSAALRPGAALIRLAAKWDHGISDAIPPLPVSYDVLVVPAGRYLRIRAAHVGHLRLVGPCKSIALGRILKRLPEGPARERERKILDKVSDISVDEGKVSITVGGQ